MNEEKKSAVKRQLLAISHCIIAAKEVRPDVCREIADLMYDVDIPQVLTQQLRIVWDSSRCANWNMVSLTLQLIANTIR